jgi:pseudo-rSAM protein
VKKLLEFIQNNKQDYNINIVGNIFSYHNFEMLLANIETDSRQYKIYITIQDFISNMQYINKFQWPNNIYFNILIDSTFDFTLIPLQVSHINISITVLLFSEENYITFENKINHESPIWQNSQIIPIWNGENFNFFHSTVFISEMEVNDIYCSKREVFIKQAVNTYDFGKLTVMPDGQVYANVNTRAIGLIDNSIVSLIYKEFTEGKSWLRIRDQKPCVDCIYQWLCPSPSNYEIVIGKYNLCDIIID